MFERARELLDATRRVEVATGIASIWTHPSAAAADAHREMTEAHPGRFLLGLGAATSVSWPRTRPILPPRRADAGVPRCPRLGRQPVPAAQRVLAALGPRMLAVARDRSAGAHQYLVTVEHTTLARDVLGPDRLLAPEQTVVLETDPVRAPAIGREHLSPYLQVPEALQNQIGAARQPASAV